MADGVARVLYDSEGNPVTVVERGGQHYLLTLPPEILDLLIDMKKEMQLTNFHLQAITNLDITTNDINDV